MALALVKSGWTSGNLQFLNKVDGGSAAVHFGYDDKGLDVKFFGATASSYMLWDESADDLIINAGQLNFSGSLGAAAPFNLDGAASYLVDSAGNGYGGVVVSADGMSQDPETASEDGFLRLLVGASIYEVPMYLNT